ncbi:hypothetical protein BDV25DRAFT_143375 [Aspergillus avenaceus]|uniref:BZIP domain-containing protein n=1 Tax=Aspergillus avenaceus TaxID=36643 RepID=A0A5N6TKW8_ASPAV|nr:hypothetical protein BDV25DRAFT_143375 [Aspergillus avenaceus]
MADMLSQTLSARYFQPEIGPKEPEGKDKKRGRPRMSPNADCNDRRAQVRAAQRTYRLKKEAKFQDLKARVTEQETQIGRIKNSLGTFYDMAIESDMHVTHPYLFRQLTDTVSLIQDTPIPKATDPKTRFTITPPGNPVFTFGYTTTPSPTPSPTVTPTPTPKPPTLTPTPTPPEKTFTRHLHRTCIEHAYNLFTSPHTPAEEIHRVFRLVSCIRHEDKLTRYLSSLARAGPKDPLETPSIPFYCIGGAGTHYPPKTQDGRVVYPENMRFLTGRVFSTGGVDGVEGYGLDGVWLDCRDVEGFLGERGAEFGDGVVGSVAVRWKGRSGVLDVGVFVKGLLGKMVILGRAPGFRLVDVEAAFSSAVTL